MRIPEAVVAATVLLVGAAKLQAQTPHTPLERTPFAGASMTRYGPAVLGGLEMAMNRWLALRAEGIVSLQQRDTWPDRYLTAFTLSGVLSFRSESRVSPYFLAGAAYSASRHFDPDAGALGGAGIRFRFGKLQPFIEARAQHRIGVPISLGLRF
jgi:hypothetical protein